MRYWLQSRIRQYNYMGIVFVRERYDPLCAELVANKVIIWERTGVVVNMLAR